MSFHVKYLKVIETKNITDLQPILYREANNSRILQDILPSQIPIKTLQLGEKRDHYDNDGWKGSLCMLKVGYMLKVC